MSAEHAMMNDGPMKTQGDPMSKEAMPGMVDSHAHGATLHEALETDKPVLDDQAGKSSGPSDPPHQPTSGGAA